jgi:hypothetical protein
MAKKPVSKRKNVGKGSKKRLTEAEQIAADAIVAADKAKKEADAIAKNAKKEADKAKKDAEKARAKAKLDAEKKAKHDREIGELEKEAKTINVRFEKAAKAFKDADDHRLAAALHLADCKERCRAIGIKWQDWVEANVTQSFETVRKLIPIGVAESEKEGAGALMLEDMRSANKAANKRKRDKDKANKPNKGKGDPAPRQKPAGERAIEAMDAMKSEELANLIKSSAGKAGLAVVSKEDAKKIDTKSKPQPVATPRDTAEKAFGDMPVKLQVNFLEWAAEQIGCTFEADADAIAAAVEKEGEMPEMPENLKRNKGKKRRKKAA